MISQCLLSPRNICKRLCVGERSKFEMEVSDELLDGELQRQKSPHQQHGRNNAHHSLTFEGGSHKQECGTLKQNSDEKVFLARKRSITSKLAVSACDNSPKGSVDELCLPLMSILNGHEDYITTSSCSGRIAVFHSPSQPAATADEESRSETATRQKRGDALGWLFVTHDLLEQAAVDRLVASIISPGKGMLLEGLPERGIVSVKCEPFVMHVQCRSIAAAKLLLTAALASGFRNSGVIPPGSNTMLAIRHAGLAIDAPICIDGCATFSCSAGDEFLRRLFGLCNSKLKENMMRIDLLTQNVRNAVLSSPAGTKNA